MNESKLSTNFKDLLPLGGKAKLRLDNGTVFREEPGEARGPRTGIPAGVLVPTGFRIFLPLYLLSVWF